MCIISVTNLVFLLHFQLSSFQSAVSLSMPRQITSFVRWVCNRHCFFRLFLFLFMFFVFRIFESVVIVWWITEWSFLSKILDGCFYSKIVSQKLFCNIFHGPMAKFFSFSFFDNGVVDWVYAEILRIMIWMTTTKNWPIM